MRVSPGLLSRSAINRITRVLCYFPRKQARYRSDRFRQNPPISVRKVAKLCAGIVASVLLPLTIACSSPAAPTSPTTTLPPPAPALRELAYDINIPDVALTLSLARTYPNGVRMAPIAAQARWDYTAAYGGSPNVYFGEVGPKCQTYFGTGIVIAPLGVASQAVFTSAEWNVVEPGFTYAWVGRFTYARVPAPGTYRLDPACR